MARRRIANPLFPGSNPGAASIIFAGVAEQADAGDLKSPGILPCGFESRPRHPEIMVWRKSYTLLTWALITGIIAGDLLGFILQRSLPDSPVKELVLHKTQIGFSPFTLDLIVFKLTLGFSLTFNIFTVILIIIALYIFYKL